MLPVVRSLMLETPDAYAATDSVAAKTGKSPLAFDPQLRFPIQVGDWGIADSPLRPAGKARFGEHFVDVVTDQACTWTRARPSACWTSAATVCGFARWKAET